MQPERSPASVTWTSTCCLSLPAARGGIDIRVTRAIRCSPTRRARRPHASGRPRCSVPSPRARDMAARTSRRSTVGASAITCSASPSFRATTAALARFQQPHVLGQQLGSAAALGAGVVPLHGQRAQSPRTRVGDGFGGYRDALVDRHDRDRRQARPAPPASSTEATVAPNRGGWSTTAVSISGTLSVDREPGRFRGSSGPSRRAAAPRAPIS